MFATGRLIRNLGDDVSEEVEHFVFHNGLFEMRGCDAFRVAVFGFAGGFGDEGDHEEFECFGYILILISGDLLRTCGNDCFGDEGGNLHTAMGVT